MTIFVMKKTPAMRIGIIGAGINGLAAAQVLRRYGAEVFVFDQQDAPGGWFSQSHPNESNLTFSPFQFSDFPWPHSSKIAFSPTCHLQYLNDYILYHQLEDSLRMNSRVVEAVPLSTGGWELSVDRTDAAAKVFVNFLVVSAGVRRYYAEPKLPHQASYLEAGGEIFSIQNSLPTQFRDGKATLVIGHDTATLAFLTSACTKHPCKLVHVHSNESWVEDESWSVQEPANPWWSRWGVARRHRSSKTMAEMQAEYQRRVASGKIIAIHDAPMAFTTSGIELRSGKTLEGQITVFGEGTYSRLPFFPEICQRQGLYGFSTNALHRGILSLQVPSLAFVGLHHPLGKQVGGELAAYWLGEHLFGFRKFLPKGSAKDQTLIPQRRTMSSEANLQLLIEDLELGMRTTLPGKRALELPQSGIWEALRRQKPWPATAV